jgi:hypothetical protein
MGDCQKITHFVFLSRSIGVITYKKKRWFGHVANKGGVHTGFWYRKPKGNTTLGKLMRKMEDNIKMDLKGIVCEYMD